MTRARWLILVTALAAALTGCGKTSTPTPSSATQAAQPPSPPPELPPAPQTAPEPPDLPAAPQAAQRVAIAYTKAARFTSARTLRRRAAQQRRLATPRLARQLARFAPTQADVDQATIDGTRTSGDVIEWSSERPSRAHAVVAVATRERSTGADTAQVVSRVELTRIHSTWRVSSFTVLPGVESSAAGLQEPKDLAASGTAG